MRISRKSEYALRALLAMSRVPVGRVHQIFELSRTENIPVKFLEQILLSLRNGGFLASKRGVGGGVTLLKKPEDILLGDVISLLDGPIAPVPCALAKPSESCNCPHPETCELRIFMTGLREQLDESLCQKSIADLLALSPKNVALAFDI
ncbi:MAG: Rrf2 family transcriptional regulator [Chthoniobacterales bacterium]